MSTSRRGVSRALDVKPSAARHSTLMFRLSWWSLLLLLVVPCPILAQERDVRGDPIRWWHGALVAGGAATLLLVDEPVQRSTQQNRHGALDRAATVFRQLGEPLVVYSASLGALGVGLVRDDAALERTGARLTSSITLAAVLVHAGKLIAGRDRPNVRGQAFDFRPFSGMTDKAFPSGHTAVAFALATTLSDDVDNEAATIGLFALATGTGWSRINDNKHWASDVAVGAVVGIASSKLVNGRWRLFEIDPPSYLKKRSGETAFGEVVVGMGAGIGLYYLVTRIVSRPEQSALTIAPSIDGGMIIGWGWNF